MPTLSELPPEQQLDFWIGLWDVSWGADQHGTNHITRILDGRVIQENFDGQAALALRGLSVSAYSSKLGQWQQTWVDTDGSYWHFRGGAVGDDLILTTDDTLDARPVKLRMVFCNISRAELDWRWERSDDDGQTWAVKWQIHYQRKYVP